jgi:hypothetical protein
VENIGLLLGLAKLALEIFKDERGDRYSRFSNDLLKIEKEWLEEYSRPDSERSDLALDTLLFESKQVSQRIIDAAKAR